MVFFSKSICVFSLSWLIYYFFITCGVENFVPIQQEPLEYNTFVIPQYDTRTWKSTQERFDLFISSVNNTKFSLYYNYGSFFTIFKELIEQQKFGKYNITSYDDSKYYRLDNIVIQDIETFVMFKVNVVFHINMFDPFKIHKIVITRDPKFKSSQYVKPIDTLSPDTVFRINNNLHLFGPYNTSANEMITSNDDYEIVQGVIKNKLQNAQKTKDT